MRAKVICAIMVYNGETYHAEEYVEVESNEELQIMIREQSVVELPEKKPATQVERDVKTGRGRK